VIQLAELSVQEIASRDLLPIGQFYLRTFETLTKGKVDGFRTAATSLLEELRSAIEQETVPYHVGMQMQDTIRKTLENVIVRSDEEVDITMTTNIIETLPWIDYKEVFTKLEERGREEGRAERDMEIALKLFSQRKQGSNLSALIQAMEDLGISKEVIGAARKQYETEQGKEPRKRSGPER
jgi:hypothetical protein